MSIKTFFVLLAEKITGRKCGNCRHNCTGRCCHPNGNTFLRCWHSITRPGFEKRSPRYLKPEALKLTREEQQKLRKIEDVLREAGDTARESGLVEDDFDAEKYWDEHWDQNLLENR